MSEENSFPADESPELPAQRDFFDESFGVELAALDNPETRHGKYTGEQLEARVAVRDMVVKLLAEGVGIRRIAALMRKQGVAIGEHSIMALRDRRADLVATEKKQLSQQLGRISKLMADSIEERLVDGKMKPSSVDLAVMIDKKMAVDGEASLVIEHKHTIEASADAFIRKLEEMKRAKVLPVVDLASQDSQSSDNTKKP